MFETSRAILYYLSTGEDVDDILREHPYLTREDIQAAAAEGLRALELGDSREMRIARVRAKHPHAFEPWTDEEDRHLREEFDRGAGIAALSRAFGRPPGAIRMRLEKLGVDRRRGAPVEATPPPRSGAQGETTGAGP